MSDAELPPESPADRAASSQPEGLDLVLAGLTVAGLIGVMLVIIALLDPPGRGTLDTANAKLTLTAIILLGQNLAMLAAVWLAGWRRDVTFAALVRLRRLRWPGLLAGLVAGAMIGLGLDFGLSWLQEALGMPQHTPGVELLAPAGFSWTAFAMMMPLAALLAPFAEEVLFRGLLFGWLRRKMPWPWAALISAIPFGLLHVQPLHILYATVAGFLLAALYQRAGSLWANVLAHVTINSIAVVSVYLALYQGVPIDKL